MKTSVPEFLTKRIQLIALAMLVFMSGFTQTYTTKANGAWSSASTWVGGLIPPINGNITAGMTINIKHVVTYSGSNISNSGTINLSNPGGVSPRLIIANGVNFTNKSGAVLNLSGGEFRQYRFVGGGETGTLQTGKFTNGGTIAAINSFIEYPQSWTENAGANTVLNNCSVELGEGFNISGSSIDSLLYTSFSVGMHNSGNGDFAITNGTVYFKVLRVEVANSNGQFTLSNGDFNGSIDFVTLKNHVNGTYSSGKINVASSVNTTGIYLNSYCLDNPSHYTISAGKVTGPQTQTCSSTYFPAYLMNGTGASRLNFSTDPVLISGTDRTVGAVYKYEGAAPGIDVILTLDSIVHGAKVDVVDDNTGANGGFIEAFQPIISSGPVPGTSYAVFRFTYKISGTSTDIKLDTASITALDIDGTSGVHEFDQISLGTNSVPSFMASNPLITINNLGIGTFLGIDVSGITYNGVDTNSKKNMFTITNQKVSTFTATLGMVTTSIGSTQRLFSLYGKSFNYPKPVTLPVKLLDFTANYLKPNAALNWSTSQEHNFNYFMLERSVDGKNFSQIALVFGAGESDIKLNYSYNDKDLKGRGGVIYYRLKQVDVDGSFTYSSVRLIRLGDEKTSINLTTFPNPVASDLRITLPSSWQNQHLQIDLYNVSGQLVKGMDVANSSQTESISVASLQKGIYFVEVKNGAETAKQQIVKN
jgi:hypothetical protein